MKRVVSIQDISCIGRCSLTVALPVISAMGVECAVVPTAMLSAHTAFPGFVCRDVSDQMDAISDHWQAMGLRFDAIYTGYLASPEQVERVCRWIERFWTENTLVFVDPAMGDNGVLYPGLPEGFPQQMAKVCALADVIAPNVTEACMLTGTPYRDDFTPGQLYTLLERLQKLGAKQAMLTGVDFGGGRIGVMMPEGSCTAPRLENSRPGTGDLFASACVGALAQGLDLLRAVSIGVDFVAECIRVTRQNPNARWYGVDFERALPFLMERITKENENAWQN